MWRARRGEGRPKPLLLPGALLVTISLQTLAALVLVHLETALFLEIAHGGCSGLEVEGGGDVLGLGLNGLGDVALDVVGGVLVDDALLGGLVHGGSVGDACGAGSDGVALFGGLLELLVKRLQAGHGRFVAGSVTRGFASGFDGGFGVGHGVFEIVSGPETQPMGRESRANSWIDCFAKGFVGF